MRKFFALLLLLFTPAAYAGVEQLTEKEFQKLAEDLAPKVNLFRDAWEKDPAAEFYGGTTRDYLYWIKGKFKDAGTHEEAAKIASELRAFPVIDVRSFIIGESDVDVFTKGNYTIRPETYGVRKIDLQSPDTLDPATELGKNERHQGFIPAEKIRLGKNGFAKPADLGDGLGEIYRGKLTLHFASPEEFATTKYAREGINHPILLALRYLRLQAIDYYQTHGKGLPERKALFSAVDPASSRAVQAVIAKALDGRELTPYLEKAKFKSWINGAIQKAFRSYTNPTAAKELLHHYRVDELPSLYPKEIETTNQYVFQKYRDPAAIAEQLKAFQVDEKAFFRPVSEEFPDGQLYHGTKNEPAFRGILMQGVLGSEAGSAGKGLYGVRETSQKFAEDWAGDKQRLLAFPVKPNARIVDIRGGEGQRVFEAFNRVRGTALDYDGFADAFGIDVVRYQYNTEAYVVKNSAALGPARGVYREILPLQELLKRAATIRDPKLLLDLIQVNSLSAREAELVHARAPIAHADVVSALKNGPDREELIRYYLTAAEFPERDELVAEILRGGSKNERIALARWVFTSPYFKLSDENWRTIAGLSEVRSYLGHILDVYRPPHGPTVAKPEHLLLFREMIAAGQFDEFAEEFRHPPFAGNEELVYQWLDRQIAAKPGTPWRMAIRSMSELIQNAQSFRRRPFFEKFLQIPGVPGLEAESFLKNPNWYSETWFLKALAAHEEARPALVNYQFGQESSRRKHAKILNQIIESGGADAELASRILPSLRYYAEERDLRKTILHAIVTREKMNPAALWTLQKLRGSDDVRFDALYLKAYQRAFTQINTMQGLVEFYDQARIAQERPGALSLAEKTLELLTNVYHGEKIELPGVAPALLENVMLDLAEIEAKRPEARRALEALLQQAPTVNAFLFTGKVLEGRIQVSPEMRQAVIDFVKKTIFAYKDAPVAYPAEALMKLIRTDQEFREDEALRAVIAQWQARWKEKNVLGFPDMARTFLELPREKDLAPEACATKFGHL